MYEDTGSDTPLDGLDAGGLLDAASSGEQDPSLRALEPLFPSYTLLAKIGRGATSSVYRARHRKLDRTVAIKILDPELASEAGFLERFQREARATATLQHPFVVTVHDFGDVDGVLYLVLEDCGGRTFRHVVTEGEESLRTGIRTLVQVCEALEHAHAQGAVHRDLKPENVLVDPHGYPRIADFGLARILDPNTPNLTRSGDVMGTPHYMAPEQLAGRPADQRSDVYAMGVMTYELLAGELPIGRFEGPGRGRVKYEELDSVVMQCLSSEASDRPLLSTLRKSLQRSLHAPEQPPRVAPKSVARTAPIDPREEIEPSDGVPVPAWAVIGGALATIGALLPGIDISTASNINQFLHLDVRGLTPFELKWDLLTVLPVAGWLLTTATMSATVGLGACFWTGRKIPGWLVPAFATLGILWVISIAMTLAFNGDQSFAIRGSSTVLSAEINPRYGLLVLAAGFAMVVQSIFSEWSSDRARTKPRGRDRVQVVSRAKLREVRRRRRLAQLRKDARQKKQ